MILIVEDNPMNAELMTDLLEECGYAVIHAASGEEGISLATNRLPDLVLMDVSLPVLDGLSASRILKDQAATANIPIVAVTAHAMKGDRERVLAAGCAGYVTKPIDIGTFVPSLLEIVPQMST